MPQLGELLRHAGDVDAQALEDALFQQRRCGSLLGEILCASGTLPSRTLYRRLAEQHGLALLDQVTTPPDAALGCADDIEDYARLQLVPHHRRADGTTVLAATRFGEASEHFARSRFGEAYAWALTTPYDLRAGLRDAYAEALDGLARLGLFTRAPHLSARHLLASRKGLHLSGIALLALVLLGAFVPPVAIGMLVAANAFYAATLVFKVMLFATGAHAPEPEPPPVDDADLPVYSILVPLYREAASVPGLIEGLRAMEYPKAKLDIKLVVEADDAETFAAIAAAAPEGMFEVVRVPPSTPRTKPKACNYALRFVRGEYLTIYDAEDRPAPDQLRRAVALFRASPPNTACIQARLNYYNRDESWLTKFFALEYALWFDYLLPGLARLGLPIPLGGTSNHLSAAALRALGEWDPFNVTEDADLGVRLAVHGLRTGLLDSYTLEEAPLCAGAWLKQRTRWIKGYLQTYFVHMRAPGALLKTLGLRQFMGVQLFIGAPCLVFLLGPVLWLLALAWHIHPPTLAPAPWLAWMTLATLAASVGVHVALALALVIRRRWHRLWLSALVFPCYWLLHSLAALRAVRDLIVRPHAWEKTTHGRTRVTAEETARMHATLRR